MKNIRYLTVLLTAAFAGCSSMPKDASLTEAHHVDNIAGTNPEMPPLAKQQVAIAGANTERDQALIVQQAMQLKELNAKKTERGMMITLGDVLFLSNKAQLEPGGMRRVEKLADFLKEYPEYNVLIEGHTDSTGKGSANQDLSGWRVYVVKTALVDRQIDGGRIKTHGYGDAYPVAGNHSASGRRLNRRVEIILSDSHGNIPMR